LISLEGEVSTFSSKGKIVLIADFNSRTGQNPDFIEKDSPQINDFDGVDLLPPDYVTDTELKRVNQDFIINSHGKKLLDLCLSSRLCILNGRFLGDSLGYFTYMSNNGFSSVDYAILSESLLPSVKYFKTNDFTYLSDHVQVELYLKCSITDETKTKLDEKDEKYKTYKWTDTS
jgi:predicted nucleic acid-binding protein